MYARITTLHVIPAKMDEFIQAWHQVMLPAAQAQHGWKSARLLADRKTGKTVVVALWESEADEAATDVGTAYAQQQSKALAGLVTAPPTVEHFEIVGEA